MGQPVLTTGVRHIFKSEGMEKMGQEVEFIGEGVFWQRVARRDHG